MKIVRYFAAFALALTALLGVAPDASARSPLCPDCLVEGVVQGSGIVPDPNKLKIELNYFTYSTTSAIVADHFLITFEGDITKGTPTQGVFEAVGTLTTTIPVSGGNFFSGPAKLFGYTSWDKPTYPMRIYASQVSTGLSFEAALNQSYVATPVVGATAALDNWRTGQVLAGTASVR